MKKTSATLVLLAVVCLVSCTERESSRQEAEPVAPTAVAEASPEIASLLPAGNEVSGWGMSQKARSFKAANLWEYIDGGADRYLAYGFEEVVTAEYVQEGTGYRVLIDIYRMKDPLNAFGIYTQERNPAYQFLKIGNEGYRTGTTLNFWTGSYYVKISSSEEKDAVKREMTRLAGAVAAKVAPAGAEPVEAGWFPRTNQVPHTLVYIPRDVLAQSYFTSGFEMRYKAGDRQYRMVLIMLESPEAAQGALARYRQFLSGGRKATSDLAAPGQGGFSCTESHYGNVVAVRSGRKIAIALGIPSEDEGKKLVAELVEKMK